MKHFKDDVLEKADKEVTKLYRKLAEMTPTEQLTRNDIRKLMFYLDDYSNEIYSEQYQRLVKRTREA